MGLQMMLTIAVFVAAGVFADRWTGMQFPLFTVLLSLAGVGGSIYMVVKKLM